MMWPLDSCLKTGSSCPSQSLTSTAMTLTQSRNHCYSGCYDFDCFGTNCCTVASDAVTFITIILVTFTIIGYDHHFYLRCLNFHVFTSTHVMLLSSYLQLDVTYPRIVAISIVTCRYPESNHCHRPRLTGWETLVGTAASGTRSPTLSPSDRSAVDSDLETRHSDTQSGILLPQTVEQSCLYFLGQPIFVHDPNLWLRGQLQYCYLVVESGFHLTSWRNTFATGVLFTEFKPLLYPLLPHILLLELAQHFSQKKPNLFAPTNHYCCCRRLHMDGWWSTSKLWTL